MTDWDGVCNEVQKQEVTMSTYEGEIDAVLEPLAHAPISIPADDQHHLIPTPAPRCCCVPFRTITRWRGSEPPTSRQGEN